MHRVHTIVVSVVKQIQTRATRGAPAGRGNSPDIQMAQSRCYDLEAVIGM